MKKIAVSFNYEVNKFIYIDVDDLLNIDGSSIEEIATKYLLRDSNNFLVDDISDVLLFNNSDEDFRSFEVLETIEVDDGIYWEVDSITFEDIQLLKNSSKYNV